MSESKAAPEEIAWLEEMARKEEETPFPGNLNRKPFADAIEILQVERKYRAGLKILVRRLRSCVRTGKISEELYKELVSSEDTSLDNE